MENTNFNVEKEVTDIIENNNNALVLISKDSFSFCIANKDTHSFMLIDNTSVTDLLIKKLLENNVEIFKDFSELKETHPYKGQPPMFWPTNCVWPPNQKKNK